MPTNLSCFHGKEALLDIRPWLPVPYLGCHDAEKGIGSSSGTNWPRFSPSSELKCSQLPIDQDNHRVAHRASRACEPGRFCE